MSLHIETEEGFDCRMLIRQQGKGQHPYPLSVLATTVPFERDLLEWN